MGQSYALTLEGKESAVGNIWGGRQGVSLLAKIIGTFYFSGTMLSAPRVLPHRVWRSVFFPYATDEETKAPWNMASGICRMEAMKFLAFPSLDSTDSMFNYFPPAHLAHFFPYYSSRFS